LRNPLGVISNAIYYLKTVLSGSDTTVKEYLNIIKAEVDNSERIISDLLGLSRVKQPQTTSIAINDLIAKTVAKCAIPERVSFHVDLPPSLPPVNIDPFQIGQVFQNLIANAVQAMPEGGSLRVIVRLARDEKSSVVPASDVSDHPSFIEISVSDTGEGIASENMKKLFQPLFTTKARGIGLGLAVSKRNVEANGGRIEVESEAGKGTTFYVHLPVAA
jgi:signal transduction histidine kinase